LTGLGRKRHGAERSATLTVLNKSVTVTQAGTETLCERYVNPIL